MWVFAVRCLDGLAAELAPARSLRTGPGRTRDIPQRTELDEFGFRPGLGLACLAHSHSPDATFRPLLFPVFPAEASSSAVFCGIASTSRHGPGRAPMTVSPSTRTQA